MSKKKKLPEFDMPTVPAHRIHSLSKKIENLKKDEPITLMFVLTYLFPLVWNNIETYAKECYTNGYVQGLEEGKKNESKGNNR